MPTTAVNALPYPSLTAPTPPDVPADIQALAEALDGKLVVSYANAAARDVAIASPIDGMVCYLADVDRYSGRINAAWEWVAAPTGTILSGSTGSRPATPSSVVLYWNTTTGTLQIYLGGWTETAPAYVALDAYKTATTNRSSTSTLANDPHLTLTLPATGVYQVSGVLAYVGNGTQSVSWALAYTGTASATGLLVSQVSRNGLNTVAGFYTTTPVGTTDTEGSADPINNLISRFEATVTVTTTGTLSVQWAQSASNASACSMFQGSRLSARKIA